MVEKNINLILILIFGMFLAVFLLSNIKSEEGLSLKLHYYKDGVEVFPSSKSLTLVTPPGEIFDELSIDIIGKNPSQVDIIDMEIINAEPTQLLSAFQSASIETLLSLETKTLWSSDRISTSQFETPDGNLVKFKVEVVGTDFFSGEQIIREGEQDFIFETDFTELDWYIKYRTTGLTYPASSAIAYTDDCGQELQSYGFTRFASSDNIDYNCDSLSPSSLISGPYLMDVPGTNIGGGGGIPPLRFYEDSDGNGLRGSLDNYVCINDYVEGGGYKLAQYLSTDSDAGKVSTSPYALYGDEREVFCLSKWNYIDFMTVYQFEVFCDLKPSGQYGYSYLREITSSSFTWGVCYSDKFDDYKLVPLDDNSCLGLTDYDYIGDVESSYNPEGPHGFRYELGRCYNAEAGDYVTVNANDNTCSIHNYLGVQGNEKVLSLEGYTFEKNIVFDGQTLGECVRGGAFVGV